MNQGFKLRLRRRSFHQRGDEMLAQGVLGFQYQAERRTSGTTALGGLPIYLDLSVKLGLTAAIRRFVRVAGAQGWLDLQMEPPAKLVG